MTSVKVAVRVRPLNQRELDLKSRFIIEMDGRKTRITNVKIPETACEGDFGREAMRLKEFTFDFSFWSTEKDDSNYSSQDQVFKCLGLDVVSSAYDGYNACVFAYGQTGSGKSYTMMGNEVDQGLIPKICKELFSRMTDEAASYRTEVSYLEIYNEKVRDLLQSTAGNKSLHTLRVREHPKEGPYVQDLSMHFVSNYEDIRALMIQGNTNRTTAATTMNDVSSRSHAIFTILFTQAKFIKDMPSEIHSKIHLVDLAGSERADVTGATGQRLKEGASINKSLVTLGNVISILAEKSEEESKTKNVFIPYRDSVLTWLLKDSLGGNSRTIMVATISPADVNYGETLSTLRYANRAKSIINRPTVNEDPNVRLIRELREEISRLRALLGGNIDNISTPKVQEKLHENEARVKILTEEWTGKWKESANILQEQKTLALRKEGLGVVLDSELPHLIGIDDDILSTGIMLYHLKEGITAIGKGGAEKDQDIVIAGVGVEPEHCVIQHYNGVVILSPVGTAVCTINGINVISSTKLTQGAVILLGKTNMFRFNHPAEAAKMRKELKGSNLNLSRTSLLSQSMNDLYRSTDNLSLIGISGDFEQIHKQDMEKLEEKRQQIEGLEEKHRLAEMDRLTKQAGMEQQLEAKRHEHHRLQQLVEHLKKETEKAQLQVRKEQAILKRRSQDLEKQFQDYLEEKEKFQVEREMERAKRQKEKEEDIRRLAETKGDICQEIEAELKILAEREQQQNDNLQRAKKELMQELEDLKKQMAQHQMELRTQIKEMGLENLEKAAIEEREDDKIALENEIQEIHADIYSESKEVEELNFKLHEVELKLEECGGLDDQWWSVQSETVKRQWLDIESREKELIEDYCTLKKDLEKKHKKMLEEMSTEKQQYETAWLELEKLEREKLTALENIQDEAEMESYQRELLELEKAKRELQERRKELDNSAKKLHEEKIQLELLFKEEQNQYKEDKLKLKTLEKETLFKEIQGKNLIIQEKQKCVYQKELLMQDVDRKKLKGAVDEFACRVTGDEHKQCSLEELLTTEIEKQKAAEADINKRQEDLENQTKTEMKIIAAERQRLLTLLEEHNIGKKSTTISAIDSPDIEASASDSVTNADQLGNKEDSSIKLHAMELDDIRKQFESAQMELDDKRKKFEEERDAELDRIEFEKLKLQEMENQERINALVEQEVKRRLFEEKVQREKHRRIEREEEKKERDNEIKKLRMMHSRELKQLKAKYERNEGLPSASVAPSKSNPYATVMSPDSVEHKTRRKFSATQDVCNGSSSADTIKISIPTYMLRSYGSDTHYEYEVKIVIAGEAWSISRRYSRFRKLHHDLKLKYSEVGSLVFPPKKLFSRSEKVVAERRYQLEAYLQNLIEACKKNLNCSLHPSKNAVLSKQLLCAFDSFFKKGLFEATRHGTS